MKAMLNKSYQDGSGWTPLMIAVNVKDGEALVDLFLAKQADVNAKSTTPPPFIIRSHH